MHRLRMLTVATLVMVLACGGDSTTTTPPGAAKTTSAVTTATSGEQPGSEETLAPGTTTTQPLIVGSVVQSGDNENVLGLGDRGLDRCSLMSAEEAEQWLPAPVTAGPSVGIAVGEEPNPVTCQYSNEDFWVILLQVYDGEMFYGGITGTGTPIDDLGEDAWAREDGTVNFLQNDWSVHVSRITGLYPNEALLEIAHLISSRLP